MLQSPVCVWGGGVETFPRFVTFFTVSLEYVENEMTGKVLSADGNRVIKEKLEEESEKKRQLWLREPLLGRYLFSVVKH